MKMLSKYQHRPGPYPGYFNEGGPRIQTVTYWEVDENLKYLLVLATYSIRIILVLPGWFTRKNLVEMKNGANDSKWRPIYRVFNVDLIQSVIRKNYQESNLTTGSLGVLKMRYHQKTRLAIKPGPPASGAQVLNIEPMLRSGVCFGKYRISTFFLSF
ncbi:uncharacterized protein LOC108252697 [Diaphorina citri]|uniref:Uncharacterized protein LOC108252697 n=1 Tax=Diaphorina citri TaxID=121845 RepID=A0A3Q0IYF8_DIACI|nr:uncharacterized protein LOC108252697 [Diaphorina citri]